MPVISEGKSDLFSSVLGLLQLFLVGGYTQRRKALDSINWMNYMIAVLRHGTSSSEPKMTTQTLQWAQSKI